MDIDIQGVIFEFIGGLGIFLLGIKFMGDGLQQSVGDRLKDILDKFTSNPLLGVLAGLVVTVLIQSSSGTTVLTVGLVNAGFMTLRQAIGVIMGANIGTTVTAFIIGLDVGEYALPILALGSFMLFFFRSQKVNAIGKAVFGFGGLFYGLGLMSDGMSPLRSLDSFHELTVTMSNTPILGVVIGTVFTIIVQSSSATIGILQGLFSDGLIDLKAALPVLMGDNIGTTITAMLAAIGASITAKRAALTHVIFNVVGTIIFLLGLGIFTSFVSYLQLKLNLNPEMTIAFAHGSFNITNTIIQFPFIAVLAWIVIKIIPGEDSVIEYKPEHLDPIFIERSSSVALEQAKLEIVRMGEFSIRGLNSTKAYLISKDVKEAEEAEQIEAAINHLDKEITAYLMKLSRKKLIDGESELHTALIDIVRDIERIGDHFENIIELGEYKVNHKVKISDEAKQDLNEMFQLTIDTVDEAMTALNNMDVSLAEHVLKNEAIIDQLEKDNRKKHIQRMSQGKCSAQAGIVFVDIISNLERIGDHAVNIAEKIMK